MSYFVQNSLEEEKWCGEPSGRGGPTIKHGAAIPTPTLKK